MFRTTCDFELLQEYLVKMVKIARASEASRRDVPGVVWSFTGWNGRCAGAASNGKCWVRAQNPLLVGSSKARQFIDMWR